MSRRRHQTSSATFSRSSPLLAAALLLAASIAAGMWLASDEFYSRIGPGSWLLALVGILVGSVAVRAALHGNGVEVPVGFWLVFIAGAGFVLGARSAGQLQLACTLDLEPGARVFGDRPSEFPTQNVHRREHVSHYAP